MRHIYSHKHYCRRIKTLLGEYKAPKIEIPLDFRQFLTFFRSNVRLGIFGKERFQYWRLLVWTLFRRPELFSLAITMAIHGHHFRKICELHIFQKLRKVPSPAAAFFAASPHIVHAPSGTKETQELLK